MPKKSKSRAKKPKVKLAKNKVALLCGLICGICVLAIGVNIALNLETEQQNQKTPEIAKIEPQKTEPEKREAKKAEPKKAEPVTKKIEPVPSKTVEAPVETKKTQSQTAAAKKTQKESIQPQKTAPQTQKQTQSQTQVQPQPQKTVTQAQKSVAQEKQAPKTQKASPQPKPLPQESGAHVASVTTPKQQESVQKNAQEASRLNRFDLPPASNGATIVIVIDDAGRSVENTKRYASLPFPITIAVLPKLSHSRACADAIRAAGKEVILHQPMQSLNHALDPGPGKITTDMSTYEIAQIVNQNLAELGPGVKGINNHEGSDVTSNVIKIGAVLEVCAEKGVYFLDSRTTAATKAPQAALERDMKIFEKAGPYLDNDIDRSKMLERMRETLAYANRHGLAIVIGHVDKSVKILPDLLAEMYPEMKAKGYRFATPSMLR